MAAERFGHTCKAFVWCQAFSDCCTKGESHRDPVAEAASKRLGTSLTQTTELYVSQHLASPGIPNQRSEQRRWSQSLTHSTLNRVSTPCQELCSAWKCSEHDGMPAAGGTCPSYEAPVGLGLQTQTTRQSALWRQVSWMCYMGESFPLILSEDRAYSHENPLGLG